MVTASLARTRDHQIADEQAALRRVAVLIARGAVPEAVFAAVAAEAGQLLAAESAILARYDDPQDAVEVVGTWTRTGVPSPTVVGDRLPLAGQNVTTLVHRTGRSARTDHADVYGTGGQVFTRAWGLCSSVGVPISVEGRLWGVMVAAFAHEEFLPADTEARLAGFTELAASAVANAQARVELRSFAEEQAALRQVATLVAAGTPPAEVFAAVAQEAGKVLDADFALVSRYHADRAVEVVGGWDKATRRRLIALPASLGVRRMSTLVLQSNQPARIDHLREEADDVAGAHRETEVHCCVAAPIIVEGQPWGVMIAASKRENGLPPGAEHRLAGFTELAATAIANTQARAELREFADEQAALRRVASLVARAVPAEAVFAAVAEEAGRLLRAEFAVVSRYDEEGLATPVGSRNMLWPDRPLPVGPQVKLGGRNTVSMVFQTGRPARIDDYDAACGPRAEMARDWAYRSAVGVPIIVAGRLWGAMVVASGRGPLPAGTEDRLTGFAELVATALANAEAQAALTASRARIVAAADTARRRIERNLHDGVQQRLVSLGLQLRAAQAALPPEAGELAGRLDGAVAEAVGALEELREIARGLHPAILTESGLRPALRALARRSAVPVSLDIQTAGPLPALLEIAAYYAVCEALTNTAKHARACAAEVEVACAEGVLHVRVRDDGRGGADFGRGSGLAGLKDRVEALGGRVWLRSPLGAGTTLEIDLPFDAIPSAANNPERTWVRAQGRAG